MVFRPQPAGLVSLRMGITQYSEVSAEYASAKFPCSFVECSSNRVFSQLLVGLSLCPRKTLPCSLFVLVENYSTKSVSFYGFCASLHVYAQPMHLVLYASTD